MITSVSDGGFFSVIQWQWTKTRVVSSLVGSQLLLPQKWSNFGHLKNMKNRLSLFVISILTSLQKNFPFSKQLCITYTTPRGVGINVQKKRIRREKNLASSSLIWSHAVNLLLKRPSRSRAFFPFLLLRSVSSEVHNWLAFFSPKLDHLQKKWRATLPIVEKMARCD